MVFVDAATAWRDRKFAEAEERGRKQGIAEMDREWRDWYARFTDAKARGVPFGEAPPAP